MWLKVKDLIRSAFDPEKFQRIIDRLNGITQQEIEPVRAVENVVAAYNVGEERKALILGHLLGSGDRSLRFGAGHYGRLPRPGSLWRNGARFGARGFGREVGRHARHGVRVARSGVVRWIVRRSAKEGGLPFSCPVANQYIC